MPPLPILLELLPLLLDLLRKKQAKGVRLSAREAEQLGRVIWYGRQVEQVGVKVGAKVGGVAPEGDGGCG